MIMHSFIFLLNNEKYIKTKEKKKPTTIGKLTLITIVSLATKKVFSISPYY